MENKNERNEKICNLPTPKHNSFVSFDSELLFLYVHTIRYRCFFYPPLKMKKQRFRKIITSFLIFYAPFTDLIYSFNHRLEGMKLSP